MILSPLFGSTADLRNQDTDRSGTIGFNEVHPHHHIPFPTSDLSPVCWFMEIYQGVYFGITASGLSCLTKKNLRTGRACSAISTATDLAASAAVN